MQLRHLGAKPVQRIRLAMAQIAVDDDPEFVRHRAAQLLAAARRLANLNLVDMDATETLRGVIGENSAIIARVADDMSRTYAGITDGALLLDQALQLANSIENNAVHLLNSEPIIQAINIWLVYLVVGMQPTAEVEVTDQSGSNQ